MKVLGMLGSPRRGSSSEILLDQALAGTGSVGLDTEKLILNELDFSPCQECGGCNKSGRCIIDDGMQVVYRRLNQAQSIILAAPIFFGSLPAQVKAMIDRHQCCWVAKHVLNKTHNQLKKRGLLILVGGTNKESFFKNAESIVKNFFALLDIEFKERLYCHNIEKKAEILEHPDCLAQALELGRGLKD